MNNPETDSKKLTGVGKKPAETEIVMTELVLPAQANLLNNLLGGQLMHLMDIAGALSCKKHCRTEVATVAVDSIEFRHPVHVGELITIKSKIIWAGRTSMKVKLEVLAENMSTGSVIKTNTAYFTYVALNGCCTKVEVPPLLPETEEEKALFAAEEEKYRQRKKS